MQTKRIILEGNVQGVGMRARTRDLAHRFDIKGWVKNRSDGSVEIIAQGSNIQAFLDEVKKGTSFGSVEHMRSEEFDADAYESFEIRR